MISRQKSLLGAKRTIHGTKRTCLPCNKQSSKPVNVGGECSELILPIDLILEIFSRLPAKSIARFRCLSKFWASRLSHPYFTELFLTRSSSHPQVLIAIRADDEMYFYSIPQLQSHEENYFSIMATYVMKTPLGRVCHSNGLVFVKQDRKNREFFSIVRNPITGKSLTIPNLAWSRRCFLGYDPIGKQYKLLSMTLKTYKVLTLGSDKLSWRNIKCVREHRYQLSPICIGGVLYYLAYVNKVEMIVSFDIRSEEFQFMDVTAKFCRGTTTLINYNGKLASLKLDESYLILEIWVLEDPKMHDWSKYVHVLPPFWKDVAFDTNSISIVGVIGTDDIVFKPVIRAYGFIYILYYNLKEKRFVKVEINGAEGLMCTMPFIFLNHVDDLKFLF